MNPNRIFIIMLFFVITQCSRKQNHDEAEIIQKNDSTFIKLKGDRERMVHDLNSVKSDHTYKDSVLIQIPHLTKGVIEGESLPVKKGTYKFKGKIVVEDTKLKVELVV